MDVEAAAGTRGPSRDRYFDSGAIVLEELVQRCCVAVAQDGTRARREHGRHPPSLAFAQRRRHERVNAEVNAMEAAAAGAALNAAP